MSVLFQAVVTISTEKVHINTISAVNLVDLSKLSVAGNFVAFIAKRTCTMGFTYCKSMKLMHTSIALPSIKGCVSIKNFALLSQEYANTIKTFSLPKSWRTTRISFISRDPPHYMLVPVTFANKFGLTSALSLSSACQRSLTSRNISHTEPYFPKVR